MPELTPAPNGGEPTPAPSGGATEGGRSFTQAEVDRVVQERLARERRQFADYDDLKSKAARLEELEAKDKTDLEKVSKRADDAERRATDAEANALRLEVALAKGLTAVQAKRLVGKTKDELEADADELLESFGGKKAEGGEEPDPADAKKTPADSRQRPTENLRSGAVPEAEPDEDPKEIAKRVAESGGW